MNKNSNRCLELDALRGLAALMVVLFHFTMGRKEAGMGFVLGITGVDLFFIISGFVIFMSLTKVKSSTEFIINRVSRLYPTYWACVSFTFILIVATSFYHHDKIPFVYYLGNMTMFQYYLGIPNLDGPYWTMIIEMIFYIGILFLFHFNLIKHFNMVGLTITFIVVILATFFDDILLKRLLAYIPLLQYIPLFLAGTVFYKIYITKDKLLENYCIIITCLVCQLLLYNYAGRTKDYISHEAYATMIILYFLLFVLFVHGKLKFIVSSASLFLGKISFALYLIHKMISVDLLIPFLTNDLSLNFWIASLCIALPIVIALAAIVTFYIEIPSNPKMKEKLRNSISLLFQGRYS